MLKITDKFEFAKEMVMTHLDVLERSTIYKTIGKGTIIVLALHRWPCPAL